MITEIEAKKMVVLSDLHLGNPACFSRRRIVEFIRWASGEGYDICVNGDGFEITQVSLDRMIRDVPEVLQALQNALKQGSRIFYIVGNHDILLEHFLSNWGKFQMSPFLNVWSGDQRIRIEHGHVYDPFFVRFPRIYEFCTWIAGVFLKVTPALYRAWIHFERAVVFLRNRFTKPSTILTDTSRKEILGEQPEFSAAARELASRGFDGIIFGHTHHPGTVALETGQIYVNSGSWLFGSHYVEVINGKLELKNWVSVETC